MSNIEDKLNLIRNAIGRYDDFPKPGIIFRDVFSVLKDPTAFKALHEVCLDHIKSLTAPVEAIAALESRGFLFGPMIALELGIPFIPIRKKGKLPGEIKAFTYKLEYGEDTIEMQVDSLAKGTKFLIIDDLLATGGTMAAACTLLKSCDFEILQCLVIIELKDLDGRSKISEPVHSFIEY